ncbi:MAG: hypothetical protein ACI92G_002889 [Candidatus Pelagisphaera sp.]|jgi:hypothetical protein
MINPIKAVLFFVYTALLPISLLAGEIAIDLSDESIIEAIAWPTEPRRAIEAEALEVQVDGPIEERTVFNCSDFKLIIENNGSWEKLVTANPRYSVSLKDKADPKLIFSLSRFAPEEFLSSLDDQNWNAYIAFLESDVPQKNVTLQHDSRITRASPIVLDKTYRQVEYEYTLSDGTLGKIREIFAFIKGDLFVFSFSGPKAKIDSFKNRHNLTISRMNFFE